MGPDPSIFDGCNCDKDIMQESLRDKAFGRKQWGEWLKEGKLGKRFLIGLIMMVALAFFLHFREVRVEMLEPGVIAKNYVVAQVDFEFFDQDSTLILRQEALKDIGSIYQIDEKELKERRLNFENFLIHQNWREDAEESTFEEMNKIADFVEDALVVARFTDPRTLKKMGELHVDIENYFIVPPHKGSAAILPEDFWQQMTETVIDKQFPIRSVQFVVNYFQKFQWTLDNDLISQKKLKEIVEESVPEKVRKIRSGSRIIGQGEKVNAKHIAMLQAMKSALGEGRKLWQPLTIMGSLLFSLLIVILGTYYFKFNHKDILRSLHKLSLYITIVILTLIFAKVGEFVLLKNSSSVTEWIRYPLFVPFAAILLTVLLGSEVALFTTCFLSVLLGISLAVDSSRCWWRLFLVGLYANVKRCLQSVRKYG
jgi:cyclic-di-AMP phosphodiesterase PgpH